MAQSVSLREAADEYLAYLESRRRAQNTINGYRTRLRQMVESVGDLKMASLTPKHIERFFYGRGGLMHDHMTGSARTYLKKRPGLKVSTYNVYRLQCKQFFDWCREEGYLKRSDLLRLVDKEPKEEQSHRVRPPAHTLLELLDYAKNPRDRAYLATAMNTALRSSEIVTMRVGHVDLDGGWLRVNIWKSKTVDQRPITEDLDAELRRWLVIYAEAIGRPLKDDDYLFPAMTGSIFGTTTIGPNGEKVQIRTNGRYHPEWQLKRAQYIVHHVLERAGIETHYEGTHTIRRAVARNLFDHLVANGEVYDSALKVVSALLNHSLVSTTERYLGLDKERETRDQLMRGKPFLSAMVGKQDNVISLADRKPS